MVLDKKEQNIVWILGIGAAVFALYFGSNWWMDQRAALEKKRTALAKLDGENSFALLKGKAALADFEARKIQILDPNKDASHQDVSATGRLVKQTFDAAGLTFTSWVDSGTRQVAGSKEFMEARYQGTALTTTARLARFLQQIENANIPARIDTISITTPKPGVDNLRVEFNVTALLYLPPKPTTPGRGAVSQTTRPVNTTTTRQVEPPASGPGGTPTLSDAEMQKKVEELMKRREEEAARLATQPVTPKKTPEQIEQEMILKRQQEDMAAAAASSPATKPATAPGGTQ